MHPDIATLSAPSADAAANAEADVTVFVLRLLNLEGIFLVDFTFVTTLGQRRGDGAVVSNVARNLPLVSPQRALQVVRHTPKISKLKIALRTLDVTKGAVAI